MSDRYLRQTILPEIGKAGQEKLRQASVLCVGVGGLGSPVSLYLAAAGVGRIGLIDPDRVDESNLQRQIVFREQDQGEFKALQAKKHLKELNSSIQIDALPDRLTAENALEIMAQYDVIVDGTDNFSAKFLINDAALRLGKKVVYGSISRMEGQLSVFGADGGPCYRCLYPAAPKAYVPNCAESGVLGAVAGVIGSMQAIEAIKVLVGLPALVGKLFIWDALSMRARTLGIEGKSDCPACSLPRESIELVDLPVQCRALGPAAEIDSSGLQKLLMESPQLHVRLIDVREEDEWKVGHLPRAELFPMSLIRLGEKPTLDSECITVLYCQSGIRSREALERLLEMEPQHSGKFFHLKGGLNSCPDLSLSVEIDFERHS
ncbi:MAG: ThiF family adenylyltransferase [Bdellovibrionia bacterium]